MQEEERIQKGKRTRGRCERGRCDGRHLKLKGPSLGLPLTTEVLRSYRQRRQSDRFSQHGKQVWLLDRLYIFGEYRACLSRYLPYGPVTVDRVCSRVSTVATRYK